MPGRSSGAASSPVRRGSVAAVSVRSRGRVRQRGLNGLQKLSELDTTGVQPTTHVLEIATPLRPDEVRGVLPVAEVVRNAPQHDERAMIVPKVLE